MATREEKIAFIQQNRMEQKANSPVVSSKLKTREEKIAFIRAKQEPEESSFLADAGSTVLKGLDYAGGIVRTGVGEVADAFVDGNNITGDDWENTFKGEAPGSAEILDRYGVPEGARVDLMPEINIPGTDITLGKGDSSMRDIGGFALDVGTDPLTYTGVGLLTKFGGKAAKAGVKATGNVIAKGGKKLANKIGNGSSKMAEGLTGISKKSIDVYARKTDEINKLIKQYDGQVADLSDDIKGEINQAIASTKNGLNNQIDDALEAMPKDKVLDASWMNARIKEAIKEADPNIEAGFIDELLDLDDLITRSSKEGRISVQQLNKYKKKFQDDAKGSYQKNGQIINSSKSDQYARFAKGLGRDSRSQLNTISKEVAAANKTYERLHKLNKTMNKNIIKEGGSHSALKTAGSGENYRNAKALKEIDNITGKNFTNKAEELAAFDEFANPDLLPKDFTGKSLTRIAVSTALTGGYGIILASPKALKVAINAKQIPKNIIKMFGGGSGGTKNINKLHKNMTSSRGKEIFEQIAMAARVSLVHGRDRGAQKITKKDQKNPTLADVSNLKGREKWAFDGYLNLLNKDKSGMFKSEEALKSIFKNPKARKLLISASSMKSDKSLNKILDKIKKEVN